MSVTSPGQTLEMTAEVTPDGKGDEMPASSLQPCAGGSDLASSCRLVRRVSDDVAMHPHDVFIAAVTDCLHQWERPDWLDVGCGWHFDWQWQQQREQATLSKANVVGLDPDWQAVSRHRTITRRIVGLVETLPFCSASFDLVTANVVVEHLEYPVLAFSEIFRVLRPGGCFLFRTPSARSYFVRIAQRLPQGLKVFLASKVIESREPADIYPAHYRANTPETIEAICKLVGFRKITVTITRARGILGKAPALARVERKAASLFGATEGNLIVEIQR
jgi:ubiquinone/menaquinone biosynthesis C-methylase UbiE